MEPLEPEPQVLLDHKGPQDPVAVVDHKDHKDHKDPQALTP
jgi:hypothetical protein